MRTVPFLVLLMACQTTSGETGVVDTSDTDTGVVDTSDTGDTDVIDTADTDVVQDADDDGFTVNEGDCDDTDPDVNPEADELCATLGVDDNCNGTKDEATASDANLWYADMDNDGYGTPSTSTLACAKPTLYVAASTDCNDSNVNVNPGKYELCLTAVDDNCDGQINEGSAIDSTPWFIDTDGDGYGAGNSAQMCSKPDGWSAIGGDCAPTNATAYPLATELPDGVDNDCDITVDEGTVNYDDDGDGYCESGACVNTVKTKLDCDDTDRDFHPGPVDTVGDNLDLNCDGIDGVDADLDGHASMASGGLDCDDFDPHTYPSAPEIWYDRKAQGCEVLPTVVWDDCDQDGDGEPTAAGACTIVEGDLAKDCDDLNPSVFSYNREINGDGIDQNCNGIIDGARVVMTWNPAATGTEIALTFELKDTLTTTGLTFYAATGLLATPTSIGGNYPIWVWRANQTPLTPTTLTYRLQDYDNQPFPAVGKRCVTWGPNVSLVLAEFPTSCAVADPTLW